MGYQKQVIQTGIDEVKEYFDVNTERATEMLELLDEKELKGIIRTIKIKRGQTT